ncbi:Uncharacterised protein [Mycobacteroides abscessus subsp. abscessus]|nr:Uncharacterised protein [Mycobacteroides abscessus subsp. abscessus]
MTAPESPNSASTPATAPRAASIGHDGSCRTSAIRLPTRITTPMTAPTECTPNTQPKARSAFGDCSCVSTVDASWMIASDMAVMSSGPASAEAITHRITYQDVVGARAEATVRATPHTIAAVGRSGSTSMTRPPMEIGTK